MTARNPPPSYPMRITGIREELERQVGIENRRRARTGTKPIRIPAGVPSILPKKRPKPKPKKKASAREPIETPKKKKRCRCLANTDHALASRGMQVACVFSLTGGPSRAMIETTPLATAGRVRHSRRPIVAANFCPFCGESYE